MDTVVVFGIYIRDASAAAPVLQPLLTKYGCVIKTRLGLHQRSGNYAGGGGLLLLELHGDPNEVRRFGEEVVKVPGAELQTMNFRKELSEEAE